MLGNKLAARSKSEDSSPCLPPSSATTSKQKKEREQDNLLFEEHASTREVAVLSIYLVIQSDTSS